MTCLHAQDLVMEDFLTILRNNSWSEDSLLMAFSPAQARFDLFRFDEEFLRTMEQGRIFSPNGECKWRRMDQHMRVVYLGKSPPPGLADYSHKLEGLHAEQGHLILWGVRTDTKDEWVELQVPHRFVYPLTSKTFSRGRIILVVENWLDSSRLPQFSRYHSIKEIEGGSHAAV